MKKETKFRYRHEKNDRTDLINKWEKRFNKMKAKTKVQNKSIEHLQIRVTKFTLTQSSIAVHIET